MTSDASDASDVVFRRFQGLVGQPMAGGSCPAMPMASCGCQAARSGAGILPSERHDEPLKRPAFLASGSGTGPNARTIASSKLMTESVLAACGV